MFLLLFVLFFGLFIAVFGYVGLCGERSCGLFTRVLIANKKKLMRIISLTLRNQSDKPESMLYIWYNHETQLTHQMSSETQGFARQEAYQ